MKFGSAGAPLGLHRSETHAPKGPSGSLWMSFDIMSTKVLSSCFLQCYSIHEYIVSVSLFFSFLTAKSLCFSQTFCILSYDFRAFSSILDFLWADWTLDTHFSILSLTYEISLESKILIFEGSWSSVWMNSSPGLNLSVNFTSSSFATSTYPFLDLIIFF